MVSVEQWAEIRRLHFVKRLSIREIARRTGRHRDTVRRAVAAEEPPRYERPPRVSKLDPFRDEIHRLLLEEPRLPGQRVRELIGELGYRGGKTILDDYLREVRPLFLPAPRTFQRTVYRPGEICQFDLWEPSRAIPVGHGQTRRGCVVVGVLGYSRAGAGALVFSQADPGPAVRACARCLWRLGGAAGDAGLGSRGRRCTPAAVARPTRSPASAASCGSAGASARPARSAGQGRSSSACRATWRRTSSRAARSRTSSTSSAARRAGSSGPTRAPHRTLRGRPVDRLAEEREVMRAAAERAARRRPALRDPGPAGPVPARRHQRLLARPAPGRPARRGPRHASARSSRSRSTRGELACRHRAVVRRATARSPSSSTPALCASAAAGHRPSPRSSSGRWPATTR